MDGRLGDRLAQPPLASSTVAIAVSRRKTNNNIVGWAIESLASENNVKFKLLHVRPKITSVPTPMGTAIPIAEVRDDVAAAYCQEMEWQTNAMLLPFKKMCDKRNVPVDVTVLESDDVAAAISGEIIKQLINRLVIGVSSRGLFSRKVDMCSIIAASAPSFCTVYVVSRGKLSSVRPSSDCEANATVRNDSSARGVSNNESMEVSSASGSGLQSRAPFLPVQRLTQALSRNNNPSTPRETSSVGLDDSRSMALDAEETIDAGSLNRSVSEPSVTWISRLRDLEERNEKDLVTNNQSGASRHASKGQDDRRKASLSFEIEKLRTELRHVQEMYATAQTETINQRRMEEARRHEILRLKEQEANELAAKETQEFEAEKKTNESGLVGPTLQFQHFTWEEIVAATSSFSEGLRIGTGTYGTVYKCNLHHTTAAVKVLHSVEYMMNRQFQRELELLSKIRHRHLLLLLGACPEKGCLVYEYMENGSLEDRLVQTNNTPPIPWFERFRIAWEVASVLVFLHRSKPRPIIHRGLKPANILLDHNFVSKVGDAGLCAMVQADPSSKFSIQYKGTSRVGTLCYIDPEYQRTGLVSPKSDVYSFGMVILQLLTAKAAIALTRTVERAIDDHDEFLKILDRNAGSWPIVETRELAALGLCCTELRSKDRPNMKDQILPALERFRKVADSARNLISSCPASPPSHFICPLLKDLMSEPCVAADGYTYDRQAIEEWLKENDTSPITNLPIPNKNVLPNHTLYTAITEWRSRQL